MLYADGKSKMSTVTGHNNGHKEKMFKKHFLWTANLFVMYFILFYLKIVLHEDCKYVNLGWVLRLKRLYK